MSRFYGYRKCTVCGESCTPGTLLISRVKSDFVPLVGLRGKIQNTNKSMISEHLVVEDASKWKRQKYSRKEGPCQLGQCLQEKIEAGP